MSPVRHKCFVSYHHADQDEADQFVEDFEDVFIAKMLGVSDEDSDLVDSDNKNYVMRRIRELYLTDSTVTIVLIGKCTWARRYVDWEIASSLRNDPNNGRSGLIAITLPSVARYSARQLPARLADNVKGNNGDEGYARWWKYPKTTGQLRNYVGTAFNSRPTLASLLENGRDLRQRSATC